VGRKVKEKRPWWVVALAMVLVFFLALVAENHYGGEEGLALKVAAVAVISGLAGYKIRIPT